MSKPKVRPPLPARRLGYAVAVVVNLVMLYVVTTHSWEDVPFLTADAEQLVWLVTASFVLSAAANLIYLLHDPMWLRAAGDIATTVFGLLVLVRIWQVFPFDLGDAWTLGFRVVLAVAVGGSVIGVLVAGVNLSRALHPQEERVSLPR